MHKIWALIFQLELHYWTQWSKREKMNSKGRILVVFQDIFSCLRNISDFRSFYQLFDAKNLVETSCFSFCLNSPIWPLSGVTVHRGTESNSEGWRAYQAYVSEGMLDSQDWKTIMKYQRKNGSLFNSPATTAAVFQRLKNAECLGYLQSVLEKFGNAGMFPELYVS